MAWMKPFVEWHSASVKGSMSTDAHESMLNKYGNALMEYFDILWNKHIHCSQYYFHICALNIIEKAAAAS